MHRRYLPAAFCLLISSIASALNVYYIGNSLTDCLNYGGFKTCAQTQSGQTINWGRHMIPGTPLLNLWNSPAAGISEPPYGLYTSALADYTWDAITLQPYDWLIDCNCGMDELTGVKNFVELAQKKSPDVQAYIYACWPERPFDNYQTAWMAPFTNGWKSRMKGYYDSLTRGAQKRITTGKKVLQIPTGQTLYELDILAKAGSVPGIGSAIDFYLDNTHLNSKGSYVVAATAYATLFKKTPVGMPYSAYSGVTASMALAIQQAAWKTVSTYPLSGVTSTAEAGHRRSTSTPGHGGAVALAAWRQFNVAGQVIAGADGRPSASLGRSVQIHHAHTGRTLAR